jgi:hypothetical protein
MLGENLAQSVRCIVQGFIPGYPLEACTRFSQWALQAIIGEEDLCIGLRLWTTPPSVRGMLRITVNEQMSGSAFAYQQAAVVMAELTNRPQGLVTHCRS